MIKVLKYTVLSTQPGEIRGFSAPPAALGSAAALKLQLSSRRPPPPRWLNNRCHVKRAVKALPECLCQQPCRLEPSNQHKPAPPPRKRCLAVPNEARWEPSSLDSPPPILFLADPGLRFPDVAILGLSAWRGRAAVFSRTESQQANPEINKEIKEPFLPSALVKNCRLHF